MQDYRAITTARGFTARTRPTPTRTITRTVSDLQRHHFHASTLDSVTLDIHRGRKLLLLQIQWFRVSVEIVLGLLACAATKMLLIRCADYFPGTTTTARTLAPTPPPPAKATPRPASSSELSSDRQRSLPW